MDIRAIRVPDVKGIETGLRSTSSVFQGFTNDSQLALSHGLPLRDILMSMPYSFSKSVYSLLAYWEPRSEWMNQPGPDDAA